MKFHRPTPPLVLASLSGQSDVSWARQRSRWVGMACLGGFSMDRATRAAGSRMVQRGRDEFLPQSPSDFLRHQLKKSRNLPLLTAINVRSATLQGFERAARLAGVFGAYVEINAHCRQPEMVELGCGEALLREPERLIKAIKTVRSLGVAVGVKGRFEVEGTRPVEVLNRCAEVGADYLHVDAMDSERRIKELEAPYLIANNGVRERDDIEQYGRYGADAVSVARASDPGDLRELTPEVEAWKREQKQPG